MACSRQRGERSFTGRLSCCCLLRLEVLPFGVCMVGISEDVHECATERCVLREDAQQEVAVLIDVGHARDDQIRAGRGFEQQRDLATVDCRGKAKTKVESSERRSTLPYGPVDATQRFQREIGL